jgi:hypothetical protein
MEADTIFFQRSASKHLNPAVEVFCVLERSTGFAPVRTLSLPARPKQIPVHSFIAAMHFGGDVLGKIISRARSVDGWPGRTTRHVDRTFSFATITLGRWRRE